MIDVGSYEAGNRAAAQAILASPERYAGALTDWARTYVENRGICQKSADLKISDKPQSVVKKPHSAQGELFPKAAA